MKPAEHSLDSKIRSGEQRKTEYGAEEVSRMLNSGTDSPARHIHTQKGTLSAVRTVVFHSGQDTSSQTNTFKHSLLC